MFKNKAALWCYTDCNDEPTLDAALWYYTECKDELNLHDTLWCYKNKVYNDELTLDAALWCYSNKDHKIILPCVNPSGVISMKCSICLGFTMIVPTYSAASLKLWSEKKKTPDS